MWHAGLGIAISSKRLLVTKAELAGEVWLEWRMLILHGTYGNTWNS